jgi:hypothetical protein
MASTCSPDCPHPAGPSDLGRAGTARQIAGCIGSQAELQVENDPKEPDPPMRMLTVAIRRSPRGWRSPSRSADDLRGGSGPGDLELPHHPHRAPGATPTTPMSLSLAAAASRPRGCHGRPRPAPSASRSRRAAGVEVPMVEVDPGVDHRDVDLPTPVTRPGTGQVPVGPVDLGGQRLRTQPKRQSATTASTLGSARIAATFPADRLALYSPQRMPIQCRTSAHAALPAHRVPRPLRTTM